MNSGEAVKTSDTEIQVQEAKPKIKIKVPSMYQVMMHMMILRQWSLSSVC